MRRHIRTGCCRSLSLIPSLFSEFVVDSALRKTCESVVFRGEFVVVVAVMAQIHAFFYIGGKRLEFIVGSMYAACIELAVVENILDII